MVNIAAVYVGGPKFMLSVETGYSDKCLWFFTQPFKTYWVSTSDAFLDMSFHFFSSSLFSNPVTRDSVYTQAMENAVK